MRKHLLAFTVLALAGAALDILTKNLVFAHLGPGDEVPIIDGFFSFGKTTNPGVIFGKFPNAKLVWLIVSIAAVPALAAIFLSVKKPKAILTLALGLILAGTIGNMYDRITVDAVRDFIKFFYRRADGSEAVWPLFNLADSYICVGVFLLSIEMLFFDEPKKQKDAPAPEQPAAGPVVQGR